MEETSHTNDHKRIEDDITRLDEEVTAINEKLEEAIVPPVDNSDQGPVEVLQHNISKAIFQFMEMTQIPVKNIKVNWSDIDTSSLDGPSKVINFEGIEITFEKV